MIKVVNYVIVIVAALCMIIGLSYRVEEPENLSDDTLIMYRFKSDLPYMLAPNIVKDFQDTCEKGSRSFFRPKIEGNKIISTEKLCG